MYWVKNIININYLDLFLIIIFFFKNIKSVCSITLEADANANHVGILLF